MSAYPSGNKSSYHHMTLTGRSTDLPGSSSRKRPYSATIVAEREDYYDDDDLRKRHMDDDGKSYLTRFVDWFKDLPISKMLVCTSRRFIFDEDSDPGQQSLTNQNNNHTKDGAFGTHWKTKENLNIGFSSLTIKPPESFMTVGRRTGEPTISGNSFEYRKRDRQYLSSFSSKTLHRMGGHKSTRGQLSRPNIHLPKSHLKCSDDVQEVTSTSSKIDIDDDDDDKPQFIGEYRNSSQAVGHCLGDQSVNFSCFPLHPQYMRDVKLKHQQRNLFRHRNISNSSFMYTEYSPSDANRFSFKRKSFLQKELINLEERSIYKRLLNQCKFTSYKELLKRKSNVETQDQAVETVLEGDKENFDIGMGSKYGAFTKEKLSGLQLDRALMKPCKLVPESEYLKNAKKAEKPDVITVEEEEDEKILKQVLQRTKRRPLPKGDFYSPEYLSSLVTLIEDETRERLQIEEKANKLKEEIAEIRAKREKLEKSKGSLKLSKPVLQESVEEKLPEITPEMNDVIEDAFDSSNAAVVLSKLNNLQIMGKDLDTLQNLNWLNDEVITFYIELIVERSKQPDYPSVYAFNTFFFPSLRSKGFNAIKRWTRKVDIFSYDILVVPLHFGIHWCLAIIDFRSKKIKYYDSMGGKDDSWFVLKDYLVNEMKDKKKQDFDISPWVCEFVKGIPPQLNGSDCGMFALKYAEYVCRDAPISFTQENMPYFRRRMVYEIITKTIL